MKILGKCSDTATARKIVPDEGHTLKEFHLIVSRRPFFGRSLCLSERSWHLHLLWPLDID